MTTELLRKLLVAGAAVAALSVAACNKPAEKAPEAAADATTAAAAADTAQSAATTAADAADTDWAQVATLYAQLYAVAPSPIVALNRAVAVAELDGAEVALAEVNRLDLENYHPWHVTRADLLRRLGRSAEARAAYDAALALTDNEAERAFLTRRRGQLA